ncbi:hypothetical protein FOA52_006632 [Chlamydomonas sp. UWO 241]|nr:hypothetical protein FOA52_006632 [Chlamydomonas sp. UWO 241]
MGGAAAARGGRTGRAAAPAPAKAAGRGSARATRKPVPQYDDAVGASEGESSEEEEQAPARRSGRVPAKQPQQQPQPQPRARSRSTARAAAVIEIGSSEGEEESGSEEEAARTPAAAARGGGKARGRGAAAPALVVSRRGQAAAAAKGKGKQAAAVVAAPMEESASEEEEEEEDEDEEEGGAAAGGRKRSVIELIAGRLDEQELKRLVRARPHTKSADEKACALARLTSQFPKWRFQLRQDYSLLLYGFGSKRAILESFARTVLTDGAVVAVNGFNPGVGAKQVAHAAASVAVGYSVKGWSTHEVLAAIRQEKLVAEGRRVYVVLHNVDGPGLRAAGEQALLAELSACAGIHLVASCDHINAPLLWDAKVRARFNWLAAEATTFAPYVAETLDAPSVLAACFHETSRRGASTALGSMAPNAQAVFRVLAETQLDDPASPGVTFPVLFRMCRERWLVSNEQALRGFLAEFHDHELVAERMAALDGGEQREVLYVPLDEDTLRKLLEEAAAPQE